jgi:methyl-accepting chemotaxis protein
MYSNNATFVANMNGKQQSNLDLLGENTQQAKMSHAWLAVLLFLSLSPVLFNMFGADFGSVAYSNPGSQVSSHVQLIEQASTIANLGPESKSTVGKFVDHMFYALVGATWHGIHEFIGIAIALITFIMAFGHYMVERKFVVPFIGILVIMSAAMDVYHILAASRVIEANTANSIVIPFTWAEARMFNAFAMLAGLLFLLLVKVKQSMHIPFLLGITLVLLPTALTIISITANSTDLPQSMFKDAMLTRPYDFIPLVVYGICFFILAPLYNKKEPSVFGTAIILSLLCQVIAQVYMSFFSARLFDNAFHVGHYLKALGYFILCVGIILDYIAIAQRSKHLSDSLGDLYKGMKSNVSDSVQEILALSDVVTSRSKEVYEVSKSLTTASNSQVDHITNAATAMEEMATSVQHISVNSVDIAAKTDETTELAANGSAVVGRIISSIDDISKSVNQNSENVNELNNASQKISQVVAVISGIAEQTNLLALNAAIEAARAGEQGRGFAVVADEVRQLASRTQKSTAEISESIQFNQEKSLSAVKNMEKELTLVNQSVEAAEIASGTIEEIVSVINLINDMMQQIATANEEQAVVADDIAKQLGSVDTLTRDVNRGVEQLSTAAEELQSSATQLERIAAGLKA